MKKQKIFSVLLACLALGLALASCEMLSGPSAPGGGGGSQTDRALHGTWVYYYYGTEYWEIILTFSSNGTWESSEFYNGTITPDSRGTYSTGGGSLTLTRTHVYFDQGKAFEYNTTVGWKDRSQAFEVFRRNGMSEEEINSNFSPQTTRYYISANTLTFDFDFSNLTYTRR